MAVIRKTITVTGTQDSWIRSQVESGRFTNDSEYIRDLIRQDQDKNLDIEAVRTALIQGEESGKPEPFDANRFKARMAENPDQTDR